MIEIELECYDLLECVIVVRPLQMSATIRSTSFSSIDDPVDLELSRSDFDYRRSREMV